MPPYPPNMDPTRNTQAGKTAAPWAGRTAAINRVQGQKAALAQGNEFDPASVGQQIGDYQGYLREGVEAYGRQLQPHLMREIGNALGGLNSIGALRSGATTVELGDISRQYTADIGDFASRATMEGVRLGQEGAFGTYDRRRSALESDRDYRLRERLLRDQRNGNLLGAVGGLLGAGVGFAVGGPGGAAIGSRVGGSL